MRYTAEDLMSFGVPYQQAAALANAVVVPLDSSSGWTQSVSGTAAASIDTANKTALLTVQTSAIGEGSNRRMLSLIGDVDSSRIEVVARFSITNGDVNSRASLVLASSTTPDNFVVMAWGDGTVERGALISNSWFSAGYSTAGAVPTDGTGWLRMRIDGTQLQFAYGAGTTTTEPTRWNIINNANFSFPSTGHIQFDRLDVGGGHYTTPPASTLAVRFSHLTERKL